MSRFNISLLTRSFVPLTLFALTLSPGAVTAVVKMPESEIDCIECHDDIWDEETTKNVIHEPFLGKNCILCHSENSRLFVDDQSWTSNLPTTSHWFEFDDREHPTTVILQATSSNKSRLFREIPLPLFNDLSELSDVDGQSPPKIFDVKVLEVSKGIFATASISWSTDRPTSSIIAYGVEKLGNTTPMGNLFHTEHLETLSGLDHDQTYQFRITAEDDFGNITESDILNFSTSSTFSNLTPKSIARRSRLTKALSLKSRFFRKDDQCLVNITGTQPFRIVLSLKNNFDIKTEAVNWDEDEEHIVHAEEELKTLLVCKKCHPNSDHHPVDVHPEKGMKVADDHPTLADGRISCISCHSPHASTREFLLIKDKEQELCFGCHNISKYGGET